MELGLMHALVRGLGRRRDSVGVHVACDHSQLISVPSDPLRVFMTCLTSICFMESNTSPPNRHLSSNMNGNAAHTPGGLSTRSSTMVQAIMPKISAAVAERTRLENPNIDLSTAENWLMREDLLKICKDAIAKELGSKVDTVK